MTPERWQRIERLYHSALERDESEREAFLAAACAGDNALRREVESLLRCDANAGNFIEATALEVAAQLHAEGGEPSMIGQQLGPYKILSLLGAGGMGEVYRARDSRLGRDVAIKLLPAAFAQDADRLRRFEQEARSAGMLNHPNILTVHDIGAAPPENGGAPYIVSELLEGDTLRERLNGAALPLRKAIDYAQQIARGLAAAHERGIVHRDLKPGNLFVMKDGRVKILDFGLAKLTSSPVAGEVDSHASTQRLVTEPGMLMGTVGFMAPEQVRGEEADYRADIFAFGAVLYEMLSGRRAFQGKSAVETMNAILKEEPAGLSETNRQIAPALDRVLRRCLEKIPEERFQSARDLAFNLEMITGLSGESLTPAVVNRNRKRERFVWTAAGVTLLLTALALAIVYSRRGPSDVGVIRFPVSLPENVAVVPDAGSHNFAISPNGRCLAFIAVSGGQRSLWLRRLDALTAQSLPGTEGAAHPFWSPDNHFIGFFAEGKLKKIEATGGAPQTLCDLPGYSSGGAWGSAGVILIGGSSPDFKGAYRVSDSGGVVTPLLKIEQSGDFWLHILPDGQRFLYFSSGETGKRPGLYVASINSSETKLLLQIRSRAEYAPPGYLLYARDGNLVAQPFDATGLRFTGDPFTVAEKTLSFEASGWAEFSVSGNGVLAYQTYTPTSLVWFDRNGRPSGSVGAPGLYDTHRLSPDGRRVVFVLTDTRTGMGDLWIHELARDTPTRLTSSPFDDGEPVWAPDGRRMAFFSFHGKEKATLYLKSLSDVDEGASLLQTGFQTPTDWSSDGQFIAYTEQDFEDPLSKQKLWFLPLSGDHKPILFLQTRFNESRARFSPNRRWVAYVSDESGRQEVYVRAFDGSGEKARISTAGGSRPCWRRDGAELFYLSGDNQLMAAPVKIGANFQAGAPAPLFRIASPGWNVYGNAFDAAPDGQRFLIQTGVPGPQSLPFTVVVNWTAVLKR